MSATPVPKQPDYWLDEILDPIDLLIDDLASDEYHLVIPQAKAAIGQHIAEVQAARIQGLKEYLDQCRMLRWEPTTHGLANHIAEMEARLNQVKRGEHGK